MIIQRTLELYNSLKSIKRKLDGGEGDVDEKQMKARTQQRSLELGNQLRGLVDKESTFGRGRDARLRKQRESIAESGARQQHSVVKQI